MRDLVLYAPAERHLQVYAPSCRSHVPAGSCALLVLHDVTSFKRLEQIRKDFVANVSHELKTPLTAIRGAVETLLDGALNDPAHNRSFVESIAEEAGRLHNLVDDLLVLTQIESRPTALKRERVAIRPFLEELVSRYQALAKARGVTLALKEADPKDVLDANRNQLAQAIGNLLDNAIKYNRPSGQVSIRATGGQGGVRIEVEDTGIGIPLEDLPRIFERFYRVDKARSRQTGGTGLGLSIVKHVAESHGGSVSVESRLGHGSCFVLIFPQ